MEVKKERISNFELMRIIAMLLIVLSHYCVHGGYTFDGMSVNYVLVKSLGSFGKVGVALFVGISGYFSCTGKFNLKRIVLLVAETFIYSITLYFIVWIGVSKENFSGSGLLFNCFPVIYTKYWFVSCYFALCIVAPLLNIIIKNLSEKQMKTVIIVGFIMYSFIPTFNIQDSFYYSDLIMFMLYYITAAYIRFYGGKTERKKFYVIGLIISVLLILPSKMALNFVQEIIPFLQNKWEDFTALNSVLVFAIFYFSMCLCKTQKPFRNKFVNLIAAHAFGVYLIHDNYYVRNVLWSKFLKNPEFALKSPHIFVIHMIISVVGVFVVCILIDMLRKIILEKPFSALYDCIENKIKSKKSETAENPE